jgi:UDP-N-acetylglucosamine transferase subunit ALG13
VTAIFVTVGAQMSFDRLVGAVDAWAGERPGADVFAQIGPDGAEPRHVRWVRFLGPEDFRRCVAEAGAVVSHAGMGTILTALEYRKPIVVMPRRGDLRETRNDHQVATAERFHALGRVRVARDERELGTWLDRVHALQGGEAVPPRASAALIGSLRSFVHEAYRARTVREGGDT